MLGVLWLMDVASAQVYRISDDRGGRIDTYIQVYEMLRASGNRAVIDGNCLSACTLILGLLPRAQYCATDRALFGFHAAWIPDEHGRPVRSALGTSELVRIYPHWVRKVIARNGGLTQKTWYVFRTAFRGRVRPCTHDELSIARAQQ
jgi:hypothetical protein